MRTFLFILLFLLLAVSCSGKNPSKTSFKLEVTSQGLNSAGGLVIFGKEQKGDRFARVVSTESVQVDIPKGTWDFGAIAWDGVNGNMTGVVICASQTGVSIADDSATVNLTLTNAHCFTPAFSTEAGVSAPPNFTASPLTTEFCEGDVSGLSVPCLYDPLNPTLTPRKGFIGSFRLSIPGGSSFSSQGAGDVLETVCFNPSTGQDISAIFNLSDINIPAIVSNLGLPLHVDAYLGSGCEVEKGKFHLGFDDPSRARFYEISPVAKRVYARTPIASICSISDMMGTSDDFASGNGTTNYPHVICNENQMAHFSDVMGTATARSARYILGRDLNLISIIGAGANAMDDCLDDGDTLVPVGKYFTPVTCVLNDYPAFMGVFDGNNRTVSHFRFKSTDGDEIGLFSQASGVIANLNMRNVSIEGDAYVGSVVGRMTSGGTLNHVQVLDTDVRGNGYVGGIAGAAISALNLSNLKVDYAKIEGNTDVGGVLGEASGTSISFAEFDGQITSNEGTSFRIGGIVGNSFSTIDRSVASGVIRGSGTIMGGIVGNPMGNILYCRSDMVIIDHNPAPTGSRLHGGIAGAGTVEINSSLFTGNIVSQCNSPTCDIGGLKGNGTGSPQIDSYSVYQVPGMGGLNGNSALLTDLFTNSVVRTGLCTTFGGSCEWGQVLNDLPRIATLDDDHFCANTVNNNTFALQVGRGSSANPYIICNPDQMIALSTSTGGHYSLRQNINLIGLPVSTLGNFNGNFSGNGYVIHSHNRVSPISKGLFMTVTGSIRDLFVTGTRFSSTGCVGCNDGVLAQNNTGTISNVHVSDASISTADTTARLGGIAALNSGVIEYSSFQGDLEGPTSLGGIVSENSGTIRNNVSDAFIKWNAGGAVSLLGGIAAVNKNTVLRNTFRGKIEIPSASPVMGIGGIVGFLNQDTIVPRVIDNDVSSRAIIRLPLSGSTNSGGIVGESDTSTNIVSRNVQKSLFIDAEGMISPSVRPIVGSADSTFTDNGDLNFALATTYEFVATAISPTAIFHAPPNCEITANLNVAFSGTFGAFIINNRTYFGPLSGSTTNYTISIPIDDSASCSNFSGISTVQGYRAFENPDAPAIADYKLNNFDIADMSNATDRARAIAAHLSQLTTGQPATTPVWIFEPDDGEDLKLFKSDD